VNFVKETDGSTAKHDIGAIQVRILLQKVVIYIYYILQLALLTRLEQQLFTISEVTADWHELMIPWRIMRPSIARDGEQLDPTYHRPNQRTRPSPHSL